MAARKRKTPHAVRVRRRQRGLWERIKRMAHFQLIIPLLRSKHAPEYTARGVAMGFAIGITPTAGFQLIGCGVVWAIARKLEIDC